MTRPGCQHGYSEVQRKFFYDVKSGKARKKTTMTPEQAEHHLRMMKKENKNLPERVSKRRTVIRRALKRKK